MNLAYLQDLQSTGSIRIPLSRSARVTEEVKVKHLTDFMILNKAEGATIKTYEDKVGLSNGNIGNYTKLLMTGRLPSVKPGELLDFFTARWDANKWVKRVDACK